MRSEPDVLGHSVPILASRKLKHKEGTCPGAQSLFLSGLSGPPQTHVPQLPEPQRPWLKYASRKGVLAMHFKEIRSVTFSRMISQFILQIIYGLLCAKHPGCGSNPEGLPGPGDRCSGDL